MNTRILRHGALATLPLLLALLGCGLNTAQGRTLPVVIVTVTVPPAPTIHEVAQTTTLPYDNTGPATATCPAGEVALGGGWSVPKNKRVFATKLSGNTWSVWVNNPRPILNGATLRTGAAPLRALVPPPVGPAIGATVTAYVECLVGATNAVATPYTATGGVLPPTLKPGELRGQCPQGEVSTGGTFHLGDSSNLELTGSAPAYGIFQGSAWVFQVKNHDTVSRQITYTVICLANTPVQWRFKVQYDTTPVTTGATGGPTAACPAGRALAGGGAGYTPDNPAFVNGYSPGDESDRGNIYLQHAGPNGWQVAVYSLSGSIFPFSHALCL
jgi:hypothetical protein